MSTNIRRRTHTRERLLDAVEDLLRETGTLSPRIDEICGRAGFTRGAFYSNFDSVEDLLFAVYERKTVQFRADLDGAQILDVPTTAEPDLTEALDRFLAAVPADPHWYALRAAFAVRAPHDSEVATALHEHAEDLRRSLTPTVVALAQAAGLELDEDPSAATRAVIAAHVGAVLQGPFVEDPEQLRRSTVLAVLRGLSTPIATPRSQETDA